MANFGYRHAKPFRSSGNLMGMRLLMQGRPVCAASIGRAMGWVDSGNDTYVRFERLGLCTLHSRHGTTRFYVITEKGRNLAQEWGVTGLEDCCEAAVFGDEGEHDPACPQARAQVHAADAKGHQASTR